MLCRQRHESFYHYQQLNFISFRFIAVFCAMLGYVFLYALHFLSMHENSMPLDDDGNARSIARNRDGVFCFTTMLQHSFF